MNKIKTFGYYNSSLEYLNASMCYFILESLSWNYSSNKLGRWLANQIPYESW